MKRVGRILLYSVLGLVLAVLLVVAGGYGFLQTKSGKAWFAATLSQALSTPSSKVAIDGLTGSPPFELSSIAALRLADRDGTWLVLHRCRPLDRRRGASARGARHPAAAGRKRRGDAPASRRARDGGDLVQPRPGGAAAAPRCRHR